MVSAATDQQIMDVEKAKCAYKATDYLLCFHSCVEARTQLPASGWMMTDEMHLASVVAWWQKHTLQLHGIMTDCPTGM